MDRTKEHAKALGVNHYSQARRILVKTLILGLCKELGIDDCYRCGQKVENIDDLTIDHKIPWRQAENNDKAIELFWSTENLWISHSCCNTPDSQRGTNKNGHTGVHENGLLANGDMQYLSQISVNGKSIILGYSKIPKKCGIMYDIGIMKYRNGYGILNFPHLREYYKTKLDKKDWSWIDEEYETIFG